MSVRAPLRERLKDPGYTPGSRDVSELFTLLADDDEDTVERATRALRRFGLAAATRAMGELERAQPPVRARLVAVVGHVARDVPEANEARAFLVRCLTDADAKSRRNAVNALGHVAHPASEEALLAYWKRESRVDHRRSVARALGQVGGDASRELLRAVETDDAELRRLISQALVKLDRGRARTERSEIDATARARGAIPLVLWCRAGLEPICVDELGRSWNARARGEGRVEATLSGALKDVFRARTMSEFGVMLPIERCAKGEEVTDVVARAVTAGFARDVWATFTRGARRYRIEWTRGGHRRADTWRCVEAIAKRDASLVNDPKESLWELVVDERSDGAVSVVMVPRGLEDPRFFYRKRMVPASSQPTLAAALAHVAGARSDDVVFDPFVGAGMELCERHLVGPYRALIGRDRDPEALAMARENLDAVGAKNVELRAGDGRDVWPAGVTLAITNPPFGSRTGFGEDIVGLLKDVLFRASRTMERGGRLVWVSPFPTRLNEATRDCGLRLMLTRSVDLGGFRGEIQRFER